jgi:hypothetical protein
VWAEAPQLQVLPHPLLKRLLLHGALSFIRQIHRRDTAMLKEIVPKKPAMMEDNRATEKTS